MDGVAPRMRSGVVILIMFFVIFAGIIAAMSGDMAGLRWLKFAGVFIAITGIFALAASSIVLPMLESDRRKPKKAPQLRTLERADTTNKLLPIGENDYIPSVVENTTELLHTDRAKQKAT